MIIMNLMKRATHFASRAMSLQKTKCSANLNLIRNNFSNSSKSILLIKSVLSCVISQQLLKVCVKNGDDVTTEIEEIDKELYFL